MRRIPFFLLAFLLSVILVNAQKIEKPTLTSTPPTEEQQRLIREGIALHDQKDYDGAIAKYKAALVDGPDCTMAMYEMALSYYNKGDRDKTMETAAKGAKYRSDQLALFYGLMANVIDDVGKPDEALKIYRQAIGVLKGDETMAHHLSSLYYNVGVTYARQKKYDLARPELKQAVELNYSYASPHYLLAEIFSSQKYTVPAMAAAARFVTLEFNSDRTIRACRILVTGFQPAQKDPKTGNINIFLNMNAPKDEGDFIAFDFFLGTLTTVKTDKENDKSQGEVFVDAVDTFIALLAEDKNLRKTFTGKAYIPYLSAMKSAGHVPAFAYLVLRQAGGNSEAEKWTEAHIDKVQALIAWAKAYQPPR